MSIAVYAGTFDPPTLGHINLIERASSIFEAVHVVVAVNPEKKSLFSDEERVKMLESLSKNYKNVSVHLWKGLVVDYCRQNGAKVLLRGIRNTLDFSYEFDISLMNKHLDAELETIFIPTDQKFSGVRSSIIKQIAKFGGDLEGLVPALVAEALSNKFNGGNSF